MQDEYKINEVFAEGTKQLEELLEDIFVEYLVEKASE